MFNILSNVPSDGVYDPSDQEGAYIISYTIQQVSNPDVPMNTP